MPAPKKTAASETTVTIRDGRLIIDLPIASTLVPSASGKTLVVASTRGNLKSDAVINGRQVIVGVNAYVYPG